MNDNQKPASVSTNRLSVGMYLYGLGSGLAIVTVFYRHFPVEKLTDPLRVIGFTLLFIGWVLARRAPFQRSAA